MVLGRAVDQAPGTKKTKRERERQPASQPARQPGRQAGRQADRVAYQGSEEEKEWAKGFFGRLSCAFSFDLCFISGQDLLKGELHLAVQRTWNLYSVTVDVVLLTGILTAPIQFRGSCRFSPAECIRHQPNLTKKNCVACDFSAIRMVG